MADNPDHLVCSICFELMKDPVVLAETGITYCRRDIERWFLTHNTCPLTNKRLTAKKITANVALRNAIELYETEFCKIVPKDLVEVHELIGRGAFKTVHRASLKSCRSSGTTRTVAALIIKRGDFDPENEIGILRRLSDNPNLVSFIGERERSSDLTAPIVLLTAYAPHGALNQYVMNLAEGGQVLPHAYMLVILQQIASGMDGMVKSNIVHCDLALRNVLVFQLDITRIERTVVKVSDFGLSLHLNNRSHQTRDNHDLPVRWMPPEAIQQHRFSFQSDVWAFGVTAWELMSGGSVPYFEVMEADLRRHILQGRTLARPVGCASTPLWVVIVSCWHTVPKKRPKFAELRVLLGQVPTAVTAQEDSVELTAIESDDELLLPSDSEAVDSSDVEQRGGNKTLCVSRQRCETILLYISMAIVLFVATVTTAALSAQCTWAAQHPGLNVSTALVSMSVIAMVLILVGVVVLIAERIRDKKKTSIQDEMLVEINAPMSTQQPKPWSYIPLGFCVCLFALILAAAVTPNVLITHTMTEQCVNSSIVTNESDSSFGKSVSCPWTVAINLFPPLATLVDMGIVTTRQGRDYCNVQGVCTYTECTSTDDCSQYLLPSNTTTNNISCHGERCVSGCVQAHVIDDEQSALYGQNIDCWGSTLAVFQNKPWCNHLGVCSSSQCQSREDCFVEGEDKTHQLYYACADHDHDHDHTCTVTGYGCDVTNDFDDTANVSFYGKNSDCLMTAGANTRSEFWCNSSNICTTTACEASNDCFVDGEDKVNGVYFTCVDHHCTFAAKSCDVRLDYTNRNDVSTYGRNPACVNSTPGSSHSQFWCHASGKCSNTECTTSQDCFVNGVDVVNSIDYTCVGNKCLAVCNQDNALTNISDARYGENHGCLAHAETGAQNLWCHANGACTSNECATALDCFQGGYDLVNNLEFDCVAGTCALLCQQTHTITNATDIKYGENRDCLMLPSLRAQNRIYCPTSSTCSSVQCDSPQDCFVQGQDQRNGFSYTCVSSECAMVCDQANIISDTGQNSDCLKSPLSTTRHDVWCHQDNICYHYQCSSDDDCFVNGVDTALFIQYTCAAQACTFDCGLTHYHGQQNQIGSSSTCPSQNAANCNPCCKGALWGGSHAITCGDCAVNGACASGTNGGDGDCCSGNWHYTPSCKSHLARCDGP